MNEYKKQELIKKLENMKTEHEKKEQKTIYRCLFVDNKGFKRNLELPGPLKEIFSFRIRTKFSCHAAKEGQPVEPPKTLQVDFRLVDVDQKACWAQYEETK